ncbi:hypothetical protein D9M68_933540 [compost metagenome]
MPALAADTFNVPAMAWACGATFITRTWQTGYSAVLAMLQAASAGSSPASEEARGTAAIMPRPSSRVNARVAASGLRSAASPPSQLPAKPAAPKPISHHPTCAGGTPAIRSSTSAR